MKKTIALLLTIIMVCAMFTACGGSDKPSAASSAAPTTAPTAAPTTAPTTAPATEDEEEEEAGMSVEEYEEGMGEVIPIIETAIEKIGELLALSEEISSEEDLVLWAQTFIEVKDNVGLMADELADLTALVPEEYQESHIKITFAVAAMYDGMTGFENAFDAALNGDAEAYEDGLAEFIGNMSAAEELWDDAVE